MFMSPKKQGAIYPILKGRTMLWLELEPCERTVCHCSIFYFICWPEGSQEDRKSGKRLEKTELAKKKTQSLLKPPKLPQKESLERKRKGSRHQILSFRARTVLRFLWPLTQFNRKHLRSKGKSP